MREQIDGLDDLLIDTLAQRMNIIRDIGKIKKEKNISAFQIKRWNEVLNKRLELSEKYGLDTSFIKKVLELIHKEALRIQTEIPDPLEQTDGNP
jgi:chorismate mutase